METYRIDTWFSMSVKYSTDNHCAVSENPMVTDQHLTRLPFLSSPLVYTVSCLVGEYSFPISGFHVGKQSHQVRTHVWSDSARPQVFTKGNST